MPQRVRRSAIHEQAQHERPERDQEEIVGRNALAKDDDRACEPRRAGAKQILGPPDQEHEVLHHERRAESREKLEQFGGAVDPAQEQDLERRPHEADQRHRGEHPNPEAQRTGQTLRQGEGEIGAQHEKRAMREIHNARDPEDQRETRGRQKQ